MAAAAVPEGGPAAANPYVVASDEQLAELASTADGLDARQRRRLFTEIHRRIVGQGRQTTTAVRIETHFGNSARRAGEVAGETSAAVRVRTERLWIGNGATPQAAPTMRGEVRAYGLGFERRRLSAAGERTAAEPWPVPAVHVPPLGSDSGAASDDGTPATPAAERGTPPPAGQDRSRW